MSEPYIEAPCPTCGKDNRDIGACPWCYSCEDCHDITEEYYNCPPGKENPTMLSVLKRASNVTEKHLKTRGSAWPLRDQLVKIQEEYTELVQAGEHTNNLHVLEEGWDVIYAVLTYMRLKQFPPEIILTGGLSTLAKIESRFNISSHGDKK